MARLDDGFLDMIVVHSGNVLEKALVGVDLLTGYIDRNTLIESFRISSAAISRLEAGPAHIDGEPAELGTVIDVECRPASLRILTPDKESPFRPIISPVKSFFDDIRYDLRALIRRQ